eukprot:TRINITY_DN9633_c0_g1_i3.p1 TRINITY_DN9633_c0_g1~~TRINITY_DN9633_c0_g1_i3.p1  ORF type:complete len:1693 (-),score=210.37 TRINITY_DN9633_c0_g1_i3:419-5497(-)
MVVVTVWDARLRLLSAALYFVIGHRYGQRSTTTFGISTSSTSSSSKIKGCRIANNRKRVLLMLVVLQIAARCQPVQSGATLRDVYPIRVGGSLGFTGAYSNEARRAWQGLQVVAEHVNQVRPFVGPGGAALAVNLSIEDDESRATVAAGIYDWAADRSDVLLGPYSSELSFVAQAVATAKGKLIMMHGAASPIIYQQQSSDVFSVNVMAPDYMPVGLDIAWAAGARTLVMVVASGSLERSLCEGAAKHARRLGFDMLGSADLHLLNITPQLRWWGMLRPDLLVACGRLRDAVEIVVAARASGLAPAGMLISMAATSDFVAAVGAPNANYIITPSTWAPEMQGRRCRVFGRYLGGAATPRMGFAEAYRHRWGENATYLSAQAGAALVSVLAAVERAGSLETARVREALFNIDLESFYGRLRFFRENGTLRGARPGLQQVQPRPKTWPAVKRHSSSAIVALPTSFFDTSLRSSGLDHWRARDERPETFAAITGARQVGIVDSLMWPMPEWEMKEVEVYPCSQGHWWNTTASICVACAQGRFRDSFSVNCQTCDQGQYSDEIGMSHCLSCPHGAHCPPGWRPGRPNATEGYYRLPLGALLVRACEPMSICLAGNACQGSNTGILCRSCKPGFTSTSGLISGLAGVCQQCPGGVALTASLILTSLVYFAFISLLVKVTRDASSKPVRALPSAILKVCVNYLQLAATGFEATNFAGMLDVFMGRQAKYLKPIVAVPGMLQSPFDNVLSLECFESVTRLPKYQVCLLLGMLMMPVAFLGKFTCIVVVELEKYCYRSCFCFRGLKSITAHGSGVEASPCSNSSKSPSIEKLMSLLGPAEEERGEGVLAASAAGCVPSTNIGGGGFDASNGGSTPLYEDEDELSSRTPRTPRTPSRTSRAQLPGALRRLQSKDWSELHGHGRRFIVSFIQSSIVIGFVLHPTVVQWLLVSLKCVELDVLRLTDNLDILCNSTEHLLWIRLSSIGLILYGLGFPVCLFVLLYRQRHHLLRPSTLRRFGFLYNGFDARFYFFETFYMLRKVVLLMLAAAPTAYIRIVGMLSVSWCFLVVHLLAEPYDHRNRNCLNALELRSLQALTVTLMARLIFDVRFQVAGEWVSTMAEHVVLNTLLVGVPLACHVRVIAFAARALFESSVLKYVSLRAEVFPEQVTFVHRFLLRLAPRRTLLTFDRESHALGVAGISHQERRFLQDTLSETLGRYLGVAASASSPEGAVLFPGLVSSAVRCAFSRIAQSRLRRAKRLLALEEEARLRASCWRPLSALRRMCAALRLAAAQEHPTPGRVDLGNESGVAITRLNSLSIDRHRSSVRRHEATVEELQEALMMIWPDISQNDDKQSQYHQRLFTLVSESKRKSSCGDDVDAFFQLMASPAVAHTSSFERQTSVNTRDAELLFASAAAEVSTPTAAVLVRRNDELLDEVSNLQTRQGKLLSELASLHRQLSRDTRANTVDNGSLNDGSVAPTSGNAGWTERCSLPVAALHRDVSISDLLETTAVSSSPSSAASLARVGSSRQRTPAQRFHVGDCVDGGDSGVGAGDVNAPGGCVLCHHDVSPSKVFSCGADVAVTTLPEVSAVGLTASALSSVTTPGGETKGEAATPTNTTRKSGCQGPSLDDFASTSSPAARRLMAAAVASSVDPSGCVGSRLQSQANQFVEQNQSVGKQNKHSRAYQQQHQEEQQKQKQQLL